MPVIDAADLRPSADQVELVAGLLGEWGSATAAELSADLRLPLGTVAGVLRVLERWDRARRSTDGWEHIDVGPRPLRRSWRAAAPRRAESPSTIPPRRVPANQVAGTQPAGGWLRRRPHIGGWVVDLPEGVDLPAHG